MTTAAEPPHSTPAPRAAPPIELESRYGAPTTTRCRSMLKRGAGV